ncbi:MAG: HAMP domain-containing sensor histidine kinase [Pseudomonadota bacterium]
MSTARQGDSTAQATHAAQGEAPAGDAILRDKVHPALTPPRILLVALYLALIAYALLWGMETIIHHVVPAYPMSGNLKQPAILCFFVVAITTHLMVRNRWPMKVTFLITPLAVYLPLIFASTGAEIFLLGRDAGYDQIIQRFCGHTDILTCGPGYAHVVFLRLFRSLPAVILIPLFHFLSLRGLARELTTWDLKTIFTTPRRNVPNDVDVSRTILDTFLAGRHIYTVFYANLAGGLAILYMSSTLGVSSGYLYFGIAMLSVLGAAILLEIAFHSPTNRHGEQPRGQGQRQRRGLCATALFSYESILVLSLLVNAFAAQRADSLAAPSIVAGVSFLTIPAAARLFAPFMVSRFILFVACGIVVVTGSGEIARYQAEPLDYFIPTILLFAINSAVGWWSFRTHYSAIATYREIGRLQAQTARQNTELNTVLAALEQEKTQNEEAFQFREKLFQFLGHDLRQPINALSFMLFRLEREAKTDSDKQTLLLARKSVTSANQMVEDVLQLSTEHRKDRGPEGEPVAINDVFALLHAEFEPQFLASGGSLRFVGTRASITAHRENLLRALRNLLSNALKYAPGTPVLMGVRQRGDSLEIHVIDRGPGITKKDQHTIFTPFKRSANHEKISGHGLGLAVTRELVEAGGGTICVASTIGKGTAFILRFPIMTGAMATA